MICLRAELSGEINRKIIVILLRELEKSGSLFYLYKGTHRKIIHFLCGFGV